MTERPEEASRGLIAYDGTRTPFKTALFVVICATWLLPGLIGHDPWKVDEATTFGVVMEMLRTGDWVNFSIAGEPLAGRAPLYPWLAAICVKLFGGFVAPHDAARLTSGICVAATLTFVAVACRELMGERAARVGVLLFIGSVGLLARAHEMVPDLAALAGVAAALYGMALAPRRPVAGGVAIGLGVAAAFLGKGFVAAGMAALAAAALPAVARSWRTRSYALCAAVALGCALLPIAAWCTLLYLTGPGALGDWLVHATPARWGNFAGDGPGVPSFYLRLLPWYAWPSLPLAAWTLWRARRRLTERREVIVPLVTLVAFVVALSVLGDPRDVDAMPLLVPLAILGVVELDTLPRGASAAFAWFGMMTFFLFAALLWVAWFAALTGRPAFAAVMLQQEVPGFHYAFSYLPVALAALLTMLWCVVLVRSLQSARRALVNWTSGITMVWMLVMTLGVPLVDQARSYRALDAQVAGALPPSPGCVARQNVGDAQRALLDYFANLRTVPLESSAAARCGALLVQAAPGKSVASPPGWTEAWHGSRPGDRNELFILFRRNPGG